MDEECTMSSRSGRRSRSGSRSRDSRRSNRKDKDKSWVKRSRSRSSSTSSSSSRSRSSRRKNRRSRSKSPVRPVISKDPKYVNSRVFVAGLASDKCGAPDLQALFEKHGKIVDTLVHHNGYGFVQFVNEDDAKRAVEAENGASFFGKTLKCNMAANRKKGEEGGRGGGPGPGPGSGAGRGGPGFPPHEDRIMRGHSPDHFGPPPFDDPFMRGRDLPPPREFRDMPPHPFGRDFIPPPRGMRDLPPPPRDPFFDDPYRRPFPPDPYYDRFRDDPYRRDPYRVDPYRDPYRDPYGPSLLDPVAAPKKPLAVDCEIIVMTSELRRYADLVEKRLKNINLLTNVMVIQEDKTVQEQVEEAACRSCLFAIVINSQNEIHRSLTLNILHGVTQEHRNMPLDDAVDLVGRSFEKFLTAEKEKLAAQNKEKPPEREPSGGGGPPHPKDIAFFLNLLVENRPLSAEELDKVIVYLQERRNRLSGVDRSAVALKESEIQGLQRPQQQPLYQQQQVQQPYYPQQQQPFSSASTQDALSKTLSMINGASTAPTNNSVPQNTFTSHATLLTTATGAARPPPPPPPQPLPVSSSGVLRGAGVPGPSHMAPPPASGSGLVIPSTLINFDNPTVQKALDNLIQSGPNLLKNISATAGQGSWSGQGTTLATSQQSVGNMGAAQHRLAPY
ncbi:uncharacterized protein LOC143285497 isoform X2 [Babylonia areolata]|uniref:uncharacterized protein LOC143285497 isoform X2 n=1 Tax=Babylonia areolata TaxID=304850 RepID=UPI003FD1DD56